MNWQDYSVHSRERIAGFFGPYRWLSNFYGAPVAYDGLVYPSNEAAYQAAKFKPAYREVFCGVTAQDAKLLGGSMLCDALSDALICEYRHLRDNGGFNSDEWDNRRRSVMYEINKIKYERYDSLARRLLDTGDAYLEETNHWNDTYWGVTPNGHGENTLGHILMQVRAQLRASGRY